jgi:sensor histidine kinase YesM
MKRLAAARLFRIFDVMTPDREMPPAARAGAENQSVRVRWTAVLGFWALFWVLFTAIRVAFTYWVKPAYRYPSPVYGALNDAIQLGQWALLTPVIFWLSGRVTLTRRNWRSRLPVHLAIGIVLVVTTSVVMLLVQYAFLPAALRYPLTPVVVIQKLLDYGSELFLLLYAGILGSGFALHAYRDLQREQLAAARMSAQLAEARLDALRMQLHPHFLFNTLNTIATLTDQDPAAARRAIALLGDLMRRALASAREQEVTLDEELAFVAVYLELVTARFGDRLRVVLHAPPDVRDALVPTLILQPLVENAVEHGVGRLAGRGFVELDAHLAGDRLHVRVRNSAGERDEQPRERGGVGLANTRARLIQLYGDAAALTIATDGDQGVTADLSIPYHTRADLQARLVGDPC